MDDEGPHLPVDCQALGDVQGAGWLQELPGHHLAGAEGPQGDVEHGQLLGLEHHERLGALQGAVGDCRWRGPCLSQEEGQPLV